jgi:hypothetical protein
MDRRKIKSIRSFNLSIDCIEKLEELSEKTAAHNKSAIVERLIKHEYIMTLAKAEKEKGNILDYGEPHIQPLAFREAYAKRYAYDEPKCNPKHPDGRCRVCWGVE